MPRLALDRLRQAIIGRLRNKIVLPFMALTLLLAAGGTYLMVRTSSRSLEDRLTAYLTEAAASSRVALVREEDELLASLRAMAYTVGVQEALAAEDTKELARLLVPLKMNDRLDLVQLHTAGGDPLWGLRHDPRQSGASHFDLTLTYGEDIAALSSLLLSGHVDDLGDKYSAIVSTPDGPVLAVGMPLQGAEGVQGAVIVGRYLTQVTRLLGDAALARVRLLDADWRPFSGVQDAGILASERGAYVLSDDPDQAFILPEVRSGLGYMVAYTPLRIRAAPVGWIEIVLSAEYVTAASRQAALRMMILFVGGALAVLVMGTLIAGRITQPLHRLLQTVQEITQGDLSRRVDHLGPDEVGQLAGAFNQMTSSLEEHTRELGQRIAELGLLHTTSADLNRTMDRQEILSVALRSILDAGYATLGAVLLRSETGDAWVWAASLGQDGASGLPVAGQRVYAGRNGISQILEQAHGQPRILNTPAEIQETGTLLGISAQVGALMMLPLAVGNNAFGLIALGHPDKGAYSTDTQLRVIQTISTETAESLQRAHLHAQVSSKVTQLASLHQVSRTISARLSQDEVLSQVLTSVMQITGADVSVVALIDPDSGELYPAARRGAHDSQVWAGRELAQHASHDGQALTVTDGQITLIPSDVDDVELGTALCVPISSENETIGVIYVSRQDTQHPFASQDLGPLQTVAAQAGVAMRNARLYESIHSMYENVVQSLASAVDARDPYTHGHSHRVSANAVAVGRCMGLGEEAIRRLRTAGHLHDVGKIGVRDAILLKPGALSEYEMDSIREHPVVGVRILEPVGFDSEIIAGVLGHHERYDGRGYPHGVSGDALSLHARILAAVDALDAMTSDRPYRQARSVEYALKELDIHAGTQFDPQVVRALIQAIEADEILLPTQVSEVDLP